jgi:glycosyltransferase involved in cell wall biosynthesis
MRGEVNEIWFVIAAFNEASALQSVLTPILNSGYSVVVVDDHSSDETAVVAKSSGANVVRHPINLGQGAALQTGIRFAIRKKARILVTFDADGQHRLIDAEEMISVLDKSGADIVLGSRFLGIKSESLTAGKATLLRFAALFTRITTGVRVTDAHNGLRAMTSSAARRIVLRQNRMAHASELISQIAKLKLSFIEIPVEIIYSDYSRAKGQKMSNSLSILIELFLGRLH